MKGFRMLDKRRVAKRKRALAHPESYSTFYEDEGSLGAVSYVPSP